MLETISIGGSQEEEPTEDQAVNISISTIWYKLLFITAFIWYLHLGLRSLFRPNIKTTVREMAQAKTAYTGSRCWGWIFGTAPVLPMDIWQWIFDNGYLGMDIWEWIFENGYLRMDIWDSTCSAAFSSASSMWGGQECMARVEVNNNSPFSPQIFHQFLLSAQIFHHFF